MPYWRELPLPRNREERFARIVNDPVYFTERYCSVVDTAGRGLVPFVLNRAQRRYVDEIWNPCVRYDIVAKSRKWGFSTLRLVLGLHDALYRPGRVFRIVAHRLETAKFLSGTIRTLYESAWKSLDDIGEEPAYFIPRRKGDSAVGMHFTNNSHILIDTAGGQGVGQADRSDDLYLTEYSDWERPEDAYTGLSGSQPMGSGSNRLTVDFNAHGTGSDAYTKYTRAKLGPGDPDWNGFTPFFAGVLDCEWYTPEVLAHKRRELGRRYAEVYPENDTEMWLASDLAVFEAEHIEAAIERMQGQYFGDGCERYVHGVDTSTGRPDGDWQVCVTLGRRDGIWGEAYPAIHERLPEDVFADRVHERVSLCGGTCVVERNVGSVVLGRLRDRGTAGLYRHRYRDKDGTTKYELGYPTTGGAGGTKKLMISDMQRALRDGEIGLVTPSVIQEAREFEWKLRDSGGEDRGLAGAPDRAGSHDDAIMAVMLALQGAGQAEARVWV